jgi:ABC-type transport system involved in multi-copper enzyme maturation permease subunit
MIETILWELRQRRMAIFWWTLGSVLISMMILLLYPPIRDQANQFNQVFNDLPNGIRELKTGGSETINVADPVQFLNSQLFYITLPIPWIILAVTRAGSLLGRDEQNHTIELSLSRPISRNKLIFAKVASLIGEFIIVGAVTLAVIVIAAPFFDLHIGTERLALATAYTALFSLSFGLIAFMLLALGSLTSRMASAIAVLLAFGGYLIASMSSLTTWLDVPSKFAPYTYFAPDKVMLGQSVTGLNIYLISVLVLTALVSYVGFRRRDIA